MCNGLGRSFESAIYGLHSSSWGAPTITIRILKKVLVLCCSHWRVPERHVTSKSSKRVPTACQVPRPCATIFAGVWDWAALSTHTLCLCFVWAFKHSFKNTNQMMLSSASDVSKVTPLALRFSIAFLAAVTYKE